jgi:ABC-type lipoprotein release transport system permease subunit
MLVGLLFRLGAERRASEVGLMTAVGLASRQVRRLLLTEGLAVAALGGLAGTVAGAGYAWLMLVALRTPGWWLAAVGAPFLRLHITGFSLAVGFASGVLETVAAFVRALKLFCVFRIMPSFEFHDLVPFLNEFINKRHHFMAMGTFLAVVEEEHREVD